jgi:hypothetical protein
VSKQYKIIKAVVDTLAASTDFGSNSGYMLYSGAQADRPDFAHLPYLIVVDGPETVISRSSNRQTHYSLDFSVVICIAMPTEYANMLGSGSVKGLKELSDDISDLLDYSNLGLADNLVFGIHTLYQGTDPITNLIVNDTQGNITGFTMETVVNFNVSYFERKV